MPKKTVTEIVSSGNNYIIQVKGNQKTLYKQVKINTSEEKPHLSSSVQETTARGRHETRKTYIYKEFTGISPEWTGVQRLIRVERTVTTKDKTSHETAYYISNVCSNKASFFGFHIRNHWGIENRLHWVKDVCMNEDKSKTIGGMAAENISIIRNIVINVFRTNGHNSIKYATELCNNNLKKIASLIKYKTMS